MTASTHTKDPMAAGLSKDDLPLCFIAAGHAMDMDR